MLQFYGNHSSQTYQRRFASSLLSVSGIGNWIVIILFLKNNYLMYPALAAILACLHYTFQIVYSAKYKRIFILLEALGLDALLCFVPYKFYPKSTEADIDFNSSFFKLIHRGPLMTALQFQYLITSVDQQSEDMLYVPFLISLMLNASVSAHCVYLFLNQDLAGNLTYSFDQFFSVWVQSCQHLAVIYLCFLNHQQNLILILKILILLAFTIYAIFSKNHAFFNVSKTIKKIIFMTFLSWFGIPVSFAPFFKYGSIQYGWIDISRQGTAFFVHTNLSHFVHRLVCYCEGLILLILYVAQKDDEHEYQENVYNQDKHFLFIFSVILFSVNTILSVPYFIRMTRQILSQQFEYLYLKYASPQQITALTKNYQAIKILVIDEIKQIAHTNVQGNRRYQHLNTSADFETNLIRLVQHKFDVCRQIQVLIGDNIFEMTGEYATLNSNVFGDSFLEMIKTNQLIPPRQISLTGQRSQTKEFADQLHQCIIEQLFRQGTGNHLVSQIALRQRTKEAIYFFIANYIQICGYRKWIAEYMAVNPQQVLYDLYEN